MVAQCSIAPGLAILLAGNMATLNSGRNCSRVIEGIRLCWCPPGRFLMGSPQEETGHRPDAAQVTVTLTRGFWMGTFEVTQGESRVRRGGAWNDDAWACRSALRLRYEPVGFRVALIGRKTGD
jgi:formylglycine-generating enzyme required for sulfatase activity